MGILFKAHVITAIFGWIFIIGAGVVTLDEGGLAGMGSICLMTVATFITVIDLLAVYRVIRKNSASSLPIISAGFWGLIGVSYGLGLFSPDQPWQSRAVIGVLAVTALFKVIASASVMKAGLH